MIVRILERLEIAVPSIRRLIALPLAVSLLGVLPGCSLFRAEAGGELTARSSMGDKQLSPSFITAAYTPIDPNTAEVFLSDLPAEWFTNPGDRLADASGSIVHMHVFLYPSAGDTPIDTTACNVTVRHLVLAGRVPGAGASDTPLMGLYAGGGFWYPRDDIGDDTLGGSLTGASHRLSRSTPGFVDPLGSGELSGRLTAQRNDELARAMSSKLELLVRRMPTPAAEPVAPAVPAETGTATKKAR
ncbi:MAG: hypothetical protein K2Q20_05015 [Phycisphaerales bacterium]|nr:hypothetical protein [Phycisphaerales bacterium]